MGARLDQSPRQCPAIWRIDNGSRADCFRHDFVGGFSHFSRGECSAGLVRSALRWLGMLDFGSVPLTTVSRRGKMRTKNMLIT